MIQPSFPLDFILREDEFGAKYFLASDLASLLGYANGLRSFGKVIKKAKISYQHFGSDLNSHFMEIEGTDKKRSPDLRLSRYACYLCAQNADSKKLQVARAKAFIALSTFQAERSIGKFDNNPAYTSPTGEEFFLEGFGSKKW